jgi:hypothetical protein
VLLAIPDLSNISTVFRCSSSSRNAAYGGFQRRRKKTHNIISRAIITKDTETPLPALSPTVSPVSEDAKIGGDGLMTI